MMVATRYNVNLTPRFFSSFCFIRNNAIRFSYLPILDLINFGSSLYLLANAFTSSTLAVTQVWWLLVFLPGISLIIISWSHQSLLLSLMYEHSLLVWLTTCAAWTKQIDLRCCSCLVSNLEVRQEISLIFIRHQQRKFHHESTNLDLETRWLGRINRYSDDAPIVWLHFLQGLFVNSSLSYLLRGQLRC